jgi:hypothetical protein
VEDVTAVGGGGGGQSKKSRFQISSNVFSSSSSLTEVAK